MEQKMYGWIGKVSNKTVGKSRRRTNTADYFKHYLGDEVHSEKLKNGSRNLFKIHNTYYYVLSIGKGKKEWAPYPYIERLRPLCLILTQDKVNDNSNENKGNVWIVRIDDIENNHNNHGELIINGVELKKQSGINDSDYYSLSLNQVTMMRGNNDKPDYEFEDIDSIEEIVKKIVSREE